MTHLQKLDKTITQKIELETEQYKLTNKLVVNTGIFYNTVKNEHHQNQQHQIEIGAVILLKFLFKHFTYNTD